MLPLLLWWSACTPDPGGQPAAERTATLVYTQNVDGDIEPCG